MHQSVKKNIALIITIQNYQIIRKRSNTLKNIPEVDFINLKTGASKSAKNGTQ